MTTAWVIGAGGSLGAAFCSALARRGHRVVATTRRVANRGEVAGATLVELEPSLESSVRSAAREQGSPDILIYNAGRIDLAPLADTSPAIFEESWRANALGPFVCAHALAPAMIERNAGAMIFVGATSSVRGGARTHAFASSKHALRGLARSLAKELGPRGVHVVHLVVDGKIWGPSTVARFPEARAEQCLDPDAVASATLALVEQPRCAWTFEADLRPDVERWS